MSLGAASVHVAGAVHINADAGAVHINAEGVTSARLGGPGEPPERPGLILLNPAWLPFSGSAGFSLSGHLAAR
jgi:hypothetical protein